MDVYRLQKLKARCTKLGLVFLDRHEMLEIGYPEPPDIMLLTPFYHKRHEINWIDSYVAYGSRYTHNEVRKRIDKIVTRYSSGLLIYWKGFSKNIVQRGVLVKSDFSLRKGTMIVKRNMGLPPMPQREEFDPDDVIEVFDDSENNFSPEDDDIIPISDVENVTDRVPTRSERARKRTTTVTK